MGSAAQIKAMKKVSSSLKLTYSQYRELQSFSQFGSDLDADTKARLAKGERVVEVLKQNRNSPLTVEHQVIIIYAVVNNYLKDVPVDLISEFQEELFDHIDNSYPDIIKSISETKDFTSDNVLSDFTEKYMSNK